MFKNIKQLHFDCFDMAHVVPYYWLLDKMCVYI